MGPEPAGRSPVAGRRTGRNGGRPGRPGFRIGCSRAYPYSQDTLRHAGLFPQQPISPASFRCDRILAMRVFLFGIIFTALLPAAKTLDVYFIDVEGGQATLIVSPSGQSMVVDTGWDGFNNR